MGGIWGWGGGGGREEQGHECSELNKIILKASVRTNRIARRLVENEE